MTTERARTRVDTLLREAAARLSGDGDTPRLDAEVLLGHCLGRDRAWLFAHPEFRPAAASVEAFAELVRRRGDGTPIAYLTGHREFWSLNLRVTPATLIPRPETELLVEWALECIRDTRGARVLELGTGSGAIAVALASERPDIALTATDINSEALAVACDNGLAAGCGNITWAAGSWFEAAGTQRRFDAIVCNPPYVASGDPHLARGDLRFEPRSALVAGDDGLQAIRHLVRRAPARLVAGGWLLIEHGSQQGPAVRAALTDGGFTGVATRPDLSGHERASGGRILP